MNGIDVITKQPMRIFSAYKKYAERTDDGAVFYPAVIYNVASKNICIAQEAPNGNILLYADLLFADPMVCWQRIKEMVSQIRKGL